jgi:hypothetical protein
MVLREPAARLIDVMRSGLPCRVVVNDRSPPINLDASPAALAHRPLGAGKFTREPSHLRPARCKHKGCVSSHSSRVMQSRCSTLCAIRRSTASSRTSLTFYRRQRFCQERPFAQPAALPEQVRLRPPSTLTSADIGSYAAYSRVRSTLMAISFSVHRRLPAPRTHTTEIHRGRWANLTPDLATRPDRVLRLDFLFL